MNFLEIFKKVKGVFRKKRRTKTADSQQSPDEQQQGTPDEGQSTRQERRTNRRNKRKTERMGRKNKWWEEWFSRIGQGALDGAMDNDKAHDGANNMVTAIWQKHKGKVIAVCSVIGLLIVVTLAGLFKSNKNNYRR